MSDLENLLIDPKVKKVLLKIDDRILKSLDVLKNKIDSVVAERINIPDKIKAEVDFSKMPKSKPQKSIEVSNVPKKIKIENVKELAKHISKNINIPELPKNIKAIIDNDVPVSVEVLNRDRGGYISKLRIVYEKYEVIISIDRTNEGYFDGAVYEVIKR